jgi:hypothetical protein
MITAPRFLGKFRRGGASRGEPYPLWDFPALQEKHLQGARLFADRRDLITSLPLAPGGTIAEVGVARGDFSEFLLSALQPVRFFAFDIFTMHDVRSRRGRREIAYNSDFYRRRFAARGDQVTMEVGPSDVTLARYPDQSFDLIYIDAGHDYASVELDAALGMQKVKPGGFLVFNDYIMLDHLIGMPYGIVPVVNDIVVRENLAIYGFSLEKHMFCDIAFRRP